MTIPVAKEKIEEGDKAIAEIYSHYLNTIFFLLDDLINEGVDTIALKNCNLLSFAAELFSRDVFSGRKTEEQEFNNFLNRLMLAAKKSFEKSGDLKFHNKCIRPLLEGGDLPCNKERKAALKEWESTTKNRKD